jgi:hypothetical protein
MCSLVIFGARTARLLLFAAVAGGCGNSSDSPSQPGHKHHGDRGPAGFVAADLDEMYPIFLTRQVMAEGPKAALWQQRYLGRWVRWTGTLISFTPSGITLKHRPQTVTFDVSLTLESSAREQLVKRGYKAGDRLVYIGTFDSYDDVFRTLYLTHGQIVGKAP